MFCVLVSCLIFLIVSDIDWQYFGCGGKEQDQVGVIDKICVIFGCGFIGEFDQFIKELQVDEVIVEVDILLLIVLNQLGVDYNVYLIGFILKYVVFGLGWC